MPKKDTQDKEFQKLFEPLKIGSTTVPNRYAYAPTNYVFFSWDGMMNEQELAYYTARAMGGTGLIIYGAILSTEFGVPYMQHPWVFCYDMAHVPGLATFADNIRLAGGVPFIQLLPVPSAGGANWKGIQPVAPSVGVAPWVVNVPIFHKLIEERIKDSWISKNVGGEAPASVAREVTYDEIQLILRQHAKGCKIATYAGFAGIEVHACHSYFVDSFRDATINKRKDKYGGSVENRNRFIVELMDASIRAAKEENRNMNVGVRLSVEAKDGYTWEETKKLALQLQEMGIDFCHITLGRGAAHETNRDGILLDYSRDLKKTLKIPVIVPTVHDPRNALQAVSDGSTDMVSLGRPLIADPYYANKVKEGRVDEISKCTNCALHTVSHGLNLPARCAVNPEVGFERYNPKYQIRQGFKKAEMLPYVLRKK
jgi:2,4-dienoyl-CoA reductase-like NADH-dependent reductase (Old Yellow Enzyme family)